jgi:hypothetical protein
MSRKSKMQSLRESKDRRAKRMAIGAAVVLAVVLAFEAPHYLGGGGSPSSAANTTAVGATTPATASAGTALAAVLPATGAKLTNSDVAPKASKSELASFSDFAGKDPFVQQVTTPSASTSTGTSTAPTTTTSNASALSSSPPKQGSARLLANVGSATIAITHGVARIGIANGSYASGAQTISLVAGRVLTLVDTADGIHYKLRLLSAS